MPLVPGIRHAGIVVAAAALLAPFTASAFADAGFQRWIGDFRGTAIARGISSSVYDRAFAGITAPDPAVLEKARFQPEFRDEAWQYIDGRVHERSVATGRQMLRKYGRLLNSIERSTGVDKHIVLAIW